MYKIIGADGNAYGPVPAEQIRQWVTEGRLNAVSKIQVDGSGDWKELRQMPEFSALFPPAPPPISMSHPASSLPKPQPTNPVAGWALGTGIASLPCCAIGILSLASIVLGIVAISQINKDPNQEGRGMAVAGIVLGCISLLMALVSWFLFAFTSAVGSSPAFHL